MTKAFILCIVVLLCFLSVASAVGEYQAGTTANALRNIEKKLLSESGRNKRHEVYHRSAAATDRVLKNVNQNFKADQVHNTKRADAHRDERRAKRKQ